MQSKRIKNIFSHFILVIVSFTTIFPFYWMIVTSLRSDDTIANISLYPDPFDLTHYTFVFANTNMLMGFANSIKISVLVVGGMLLTASMAAYAFSKIAFKGKGLIFAILLSTMMVPGMVTLIPQYVLFSKLGWVDSHLPLIVPGIFINAYGVFLLRSFMTGIPDSYIESAKLDGCNQFRIYRTIILPLCRPALVALALITFIGNWNNFLAPLIYLSDVKMFTIPLIISTFRDAYSTQYGNLMAASSLSIIPIMVAYFFSQRFFIEGIALTGVKA